MPLLAVTAAVAEGPLYWVWMIWLLLVPPRPGLVTVKFTVAPAVLRTRSAMVSVEGSTVLAAGVTVMVLAPPELAPPRRVTVPVEALPCTPR
jgi:hypothetical protein